MDRSYKQHFKEVSSSLSDFSRVELLGLIEDSNAIINQVKAILGVECSRIVRTIPPDIWKVIFNHVLANNPDSLFVKDKKALGVTLNIPYSEQIDENKLSADFWQVKKEEKQLQLLSCVHSDWSMFVSEFVRIRYIDTPNYSDWRLNHFTHLRTLNLYSSVGINNVTDKALIKMTNLVSLNLHSNNVITNESVSKLTNLTDLNIGWNRIFQIQHLTNLTSLYCHSNSVITNQILSKLTRLEKLNMIDCPKISGVGVKTLVNLKELSTGRYNHVKPLLTDTDISKMTNLTCLEIPRNDKITNAGLKNLSNLRKLDIYYSPTISDNGISKMTNLTWLNCEGNEKISDVGIKNMTNLTWLNCQGRDMNISYEGIKNMVNLTHLSYNGSKIKESNLKRFSNLVPAEVVY